MSARIVVTGLGVVAPNGVGLAEFENSLREGKSGVRKDESMEDNGFGCRVAAVPQGIDEICDSSFSKELILSMNSGQRFASLAALEAWKHAGLVVPDAMDDGAIDWDTGTVFGTGIGGMDTIAEHVVPLVNAGKVRRLGGTAVEKVMASGVSARISGLLALGNQVTSNSSACSTGTEAIIEGMERLRRGRAQRMLCGGAEGATRYIWAGFDAMRVLARKWNDDPTKASRPMSASAGGFVPGAGAGALVLETLASAEKRGAQIHAEVLGGALNCGGHRSGGSMTAPNTIGVERCIRAALDDAEILPEEIDAISGHLTATGADPKEIGSWSRALDRGPDIFPTIFSTKSLIGHTLGAAGAIESVAGVLMLSKGFVHPSLNCEDIHPDIEPFEASVQRRLDEDIDHRVMIKASFGFGDVNACVVYRKWE